MLLQGQVKDLSSRTTFNPVKAVLPRRNAHTLRSVTCSAQPQESSRPIQTVLAATALAAAIGLGSVDAARADISGLTPCAESKQFAKRQKTEVKTLQRRLKNVRVPPGGHLTALHIHGTAKLSSDVSSCLAVRARQCSSVGLERHHRQDRNPVCYIC